MAKSKTKWDKVRGILGSVGMAASTVASIVKMLRDTGLLSASLTNHNVRVTRPVYRKLQAALNAGSSVPAKRKPTKARAKKVKVSG